MAEKPGTPALDSADVALRRGSNYPATYLEIGDRRRDHAITYPDINLRLEPAPEGRVFTNGKGEPY